MIQTDKQCKLDNTKAELFTLDELYEKQGFPFRAIKLRDESAKVHEEVKSIPLFTVRTFTEKST